MFHKKRMRRNDSNSSPQDLIFFDCETKPENGSDPRGFGLHKLWFGCATYVRLDNGKPTRRKECIFHSRSEFWEFVRSCHRPKSTLWIFAHNAAFDLTIVGLWELVEKESITLIKRTDAERLEKEQEPDKESREPVLILDAPPILIFAYDQTGQDYKFLDTLNYWRCSLATLGQGIGVPKLDMPPSNAPLESWYLYCMRDVLIIEQATIGLINWVRDENLGKFSFTSPSQAMHAYRHRFITKPILYHDHKDARALERQAYYGGHVECFWLGERKSKIYQLDVTSLYPSVMSDNLYPYDLNRYYPPMEGSYYDISHGGFNRLAHVRINTMERTYPKRMKDGVYHATGYYDTWLCGPELHSAIQAGHVDRCYSYADYGMTDLFTPFVTYFWQKRKEYKLANNRMGDLLCKLMMNSLYGKFGQMGSEWQTIYPTVCDGRWCLVNAPEFGSDISRTYRQLGTVCQLQIETDEIGTAFPAIAAWVTAYGREYMQQLRSIAGATHVYYLAVDALYVDDIGLDNLKQAGQVGNKQLGLLELVDAYDSAEFRGINNYTIGPKVVRGAVKPDAKQIGPHTFSEAKFESLASVLHNPLEGGINISPVTKVMKDSYNRGTVRPSQLVTPFYLDEYPVTVD